MSGHLCRAYKRPMVTPSKNSEGKCPRGMATMVVLRMSSRGPRDKKLSGLRTRERNQHTPERTPSCFDSRILAHTNEPVDRCTLISYRQ
ncbi:uncharacterized protein PHACADRAFT_263928 [Phanerochaete carnosa HHB-10118-sp]|uniref:Uncharacterized protein n=1 Tax=Phanerochaete carnosa (strain HHB-10118-sp) TaxID=650164 RepID=K5VUT2_PHACS|nr:uncharacterized protein PHACADRAFT_263928 [Phanerochaete carnosa HHB-10118-sp]EKM50575.1 hypothetical protein PHACADRAFT_263928 [Phanerochaete carnosa HHB-10118-sp]